MDKTHYRNVDLELESATDLSSLAEHFGERVLVLLNDWVGEGYRLALETWEFFSVPGESDADACIQSFLALLATMPPSIRALWAGCRSRVFDIGFTAGTAPPSFTQIISAATLAQVAAQDASIRITIYHCEVSPPVPAPTTGDAG